MDFVLDTRSAKKLSSSVFDVAPPSTTSDNKPGIKITAKEEGEIEFYFGDTGVAVKSTTNGEVKEAGSVQVELASLFKAVSGFYTLKDRVGTDKIRFSGDAQKLNVSATSVYKNKKVRQRRGLSNYNVPMFEMPLNFDSVVDISINVFCNALKRILLSSPSSADVGGFSGVYFCVSGGEFKLVSMDGPTLTEFIGYTSVVAPENFSCVLPTQFVSRLCKLLSKYTSEEEDDEEDLSIGLDSKVFFIRFNGNVVASSTINESFPEYESIFSKPKNKIVIETDIFCDNIKNIIHSSDKEDNSRVLVKSLGDEVSLSTESCVNDGIPTIEGSPFSLEFNGILLESCIRNLVCSEFCMYYTGKESVAIIEPIDGEFKVKTAIAPLR